ncbi:MAG: sugar phosphate isomerase/epimerase family protein [Candidatus Bipolaricaulia bacterium]
MNLQKLEDRITEKHNTNCTIGISTLLTPNNPFQGVSKLLKADLNVRRIEIALAKQLKDEERIVQSLVDLKTEHELQYSVHAPFLYDDLAHPKEPIRDIFVNEGKKAIDFATKIGASHTVFHPGELFFRQNLPPLQLFDSFKQPRGSYLDNSLKSLKRLSNYASQNGIDLLIENQPHGLCDRHEEIKYLSSQLENADFLLDIGHANISGSLEDLLKLNPQNFHFSDNDGKEDLHRQLGAGTIDLTWVMDRLLDYKESKEIIFELYSLKDVLASIEVLKTKLGI